MHSHNDLSVTTYCTTVSSTDSVLAPGSCVPPPWPTLAHHGVGQVALTQTEDVSFERFRIRWRRSVLVGSFKVAPHMSTRSGDMEYG